MAEKRVRRSKVLIEIDQRIAEQDQIIREATLRRDQLVEIRRSFEEAGSGPTPA